MRCVYPVRAFQHLDGGQVVFGHNVHEPSSVPVDHREVTLRCGRCVGCRLTRSEGWSIRCMNEARMWRDNCFVTLTYEDSKLGSLSLNYNDFQLFMKRLRKTGRKVRFFMCGEYGEINRRPHFHAILFNCDFPDRVIHRADLDGNHLYRSAELERLWPFGFSSIGTVSRQSAQYVANYSLSGQGEDDKYSLDDRTGELVEVVKPFAHMSLKPGIGSTWYDKFGSDVRSGDCSIVAGSRLRPPKYYDRKLEEFSVDEYEEVKHRRYLYSLTLMGDSTPGRLLAQETCAKARFDLKRRNL